MTTAAQPWKTPMLGQLVSELDRIEPRTRVAVTGLHEAKFREAPPDGGWSVAQVFEHLCLANRSYLDGPLPAAVARSIARGRSDREWKPSWLGGWLAQSLMEGTKPVPTPRLYRVTGELRGDVVDEFLASVRLTRELMQQADGHDLRVMFASPVSSLIRLNVGDAFRVIVVHCHRHLAQAERTRRAVGM